MSEMNETESGAEKTVAQEAGAEATLLGTTVTCPVCNAENAPGEKYCGDCGFLLSSTPGEAAPAYDISAQPRLVDVSGQREYLLREGENTVGREAADVLLADPTVSRKHALITLDADKCWVEDSGSTNGTYVAGTQIQPGERVEIANGTELKFGSAVLVLSLPQVERAEALEVSGEEAPVPPAAAEEVAEVPAAEEVEQAASAAEEELAPHSAGLVEEVQPVARLIGVSDPALSFAIKPGTNGLGRRADSDIPLNDPYVSGVHADITAEEGEFYVVDMRSTNGTLLNGSKITPGIRVALNDGDEITVGQTTFRFEILDQSAGEPSDE